MRAFIWNHGLQIEQHRRFVWLGGQWSSTCGIQVTGYAGNVFLDRPLCLQVTSGTPWLLGVVPGISIIGSWVMVLVNCNSQGMPINNGGSLSRQNFIVTRPMSSIQWLAVGNGYPDRQVPATCFGGGAMGQLRQTLLEAASASLSQIP